MTVCWGWMECQCCYSEESEPISYCTLDNEGQASYCRTCLETIQAGRWSNYMQEIKNADCEAAIRRLADHGVTTVLTIRDVDHTKKDDYTPLTRLHVASTDIPHQLPDVSLTDEQVAKLNQSLKELIGQHAITNQHIYDICRTFSI